MRYRVLLFPLAAIVVVLLGALFFGNLNGNLVYYLTPSEAAARRVEFPDGRRFRLAGEVEIGSLRTRPDGADFVVSDGGRRIPVVHRGAPPQLFQEGIQVVVEGAWRGDQFVTDTIIVKHDANYQPPVPDAAKPAAPDAAM